MRGARTGSILLTLGAAAALFWPLPQPEREQPEPQKAQSKAAQARATAEPKPQPQPNKAKASPKAATSAVTLPPPPPKTDQTTAKTVAKRPQTAERQSRDAVPEAEPSDSASPKRATKKTAASAPPTPPEAKKPAPEPEPEPENPTQITALEPEADADAPDNEPKVVRALRPTPAPKPEPARTPKPTPDPAESRNTQTPAAARPAAQASRERPTQAAPEPAASDQPAEPTGATATAAGSQTIRVDASNRDASARGATLLRLMEHGSGPGIEIAWPDGADARARLYDRLTDCLGMTTVVLGDGKKLFRADDPAGRAWIPNGDRYSGFMRQPEGYLAPAERRKAERIRARHDLTAGAPAVRLFPRAVDAALLGGLRRALGTRYTSAERIVGRYRLDGGRVRVVDIAADGEPVAGRIVLGGACSGAGL